MALDAIQIPACIICHGSASAVEIILDSTGDTSGARHAPVADWRLILCLADGIEWNRMESNGLNQFSKQQQQQ